MKTLRFTMLPLVVLFCSIQFVFSQNYWTRLSGPNGGDVMEIMKHSNGELYAIRSEALYKSTNDGNAWNRVQQADINSNLCMDISPSGTIYVGKSTGGIWWTPNNGQSWSFNPVSVAPHSGLWATVVLVKINSLGHVYINNYVSFNGGVNFTNFTIGTPSVLSRDYAFNSSNHVYTSTQSGIYFSVNNGSSWTSINGNLPSINSTSLMFDNDVLITGITGSGIYNTTNNGTTWTAMNNGLTDFSISKLYKDAQNNYYAGTSSGKVFKSINQGATWTQIYSNINNHINSIRTFGNSIYLSSLYFGIESSEDNGITWNQKNNNLLISGISSLAFSNNHEIYAGSYNGFYYSSNDGTSWQRRGAGSLPTPRINSIFREANGNILVGLREYGIYRSTDNGNSWQESNNGIIAENMFNHIKKSPNGFLYTLGSSFDDTLRLYRSSDNGMNWTKLFRPNSSQFHQFTIDGSGRLYLAGTSASLQASIIRSTDNGNTWSQIVLPQFDFTDNLTAFGNNLYMTTTAKLYTSTDMGSTWTQLNSGNFGSVRFSSMTINRNGHIFLSITNKVHVTTDNGISWNIQSSGIPNNAAINDLIFDDNDFLFAMSQDHGIFKSIQSTITSTGNGISIIPEQFKLSQNYPNPFNPNTVISYQLAVSSFASLKIYDVLGNEVETLLNEKQNAGIYNVEFDAINYPSGIYFYKLSTESFSDTKRMILLK